MIIDFNQFLSMLLYISLIVLVIILIILGIKLIKTLKKVDSVIDDVNGKMSRLTGIFDIIDKTTDYASLISDKVLNAIYSVVNVFTKRKKGHDKYEEE